MMADNGETLKFRNNDFDFLLKQKVVDWIDLAINKSVANDLRGSFEALKKVSGLISYYDFSYKADCLALEKALMEHFDSLGAKIPNRRDMIMIANRQQKSLFELLDIYFTTVVKSYAELGLWFDARVESDDFELLLSEENFNDEYSGVVEKKSFLSKLSADDLVSLLSKNAVLELFYKFQVKQVLEDD